MRFKRDTFSWLAFDYARKVVSGAIPACWQTRAQCQRSVDLFKRKDIYYDLEGAEHACRFISSLPHVIGPLAGEPIELLPFQAFIIVNLFGFKRKATKLRLHREAFCLLPRGSGKSTLAAPIAIYMTFALGQGGAQGLVGATSMKQTEAVFNPVKWMIERTPEIQEALGLEVNAKSVFQQSTSSSIQPVIAKTKDGGIPWICIADELHESIDGTQLAAFRTGMGKRRGADPLLLIISTAGTNLAGVCRSEQLYFENVLKGAIEDDAKFALIYTIDDEDDWKDFSVWKKANPSYGAAVDEEHLRAQYLKALQSPMHQAEALTKYLNIWCNTASGVINPLDWKAIADANLVIPPDAPCWIGVDLAKVSDMIALCVVANLEDGRKAIKPTFFLPEGAIGRNGKNATAYVEWIDAGAIRKTDGNGGDQGAVEDAIRDLCRLYNVQGVLFDPWQSAGMSQRLAAEGLNVIEFRQTIANFSPALTDFEADLLNRKLVHDDNPCMNWMSSNLSAKTVGAMRSPVKPTGQEHLKIDGMITLLMAFAASNVPEPEPTPEFQIFVLD